jgi:ATP-dependent Clp protease adaptor protein ClpS
MRYGLLLLQCYKKYSTQFLLMVNAFLYFCPQMFVYTMKQLNHPIMAIQPKTWEHIEPCILEEVLEVELKDLVVFNDEVNTFDHVINTLVEVCEHSLEQAEQCTLLIHYKGKCAVKKGDFDELAPMRNAICKRGISAEIY